MKKVAFILGFLLVFALGVPARGENVHELFFMHYLTGADGFALQDLVDKFNAEHPNIHVVASTTPGMVEKLLVQSAAGAPPDIAMAAPEMLPVFASAGILSPIDMGRFKSIIVQEDQYVPAAWESAQYKGVLYGVPLGVGSFGLYMNPRLFEEAGVAVKAPETLEQLNKAIRALNKDTNGDGKWEQAGLELPFNPDILITWYSVLKQYGGSIFDANGEVAFGSPAGMRALEQVVELFQSNGLVIEPRLDFVQQRSAMSLRKAAARYNMVQGGVTYRTAPFPQFGDQPGTWAGVQNVVIPVGNHSPERLNAIYTFVEWLGSQGLEWATKLGHLPARWDVIRTPEIVRSEHHYGFVLQTMYLHLYPTVTEWSKISSIVQPMVNQAVRGAGSPRNLMEDAVQRAKATLAQ